MLWRAPNGDEVNEGRAWVLAAVTDGNGTGEPGSEEPEVPGDDSVGDGSW